MKFEQKDFIPTTKADIDAYKNVRPEHLDIPEKPRELILKLGKHITDRVVSKITPSDPEYYGLDILASDEMAELALKMKVHKYYTVEELVKRSGKSREKVQQLLDEGSHSGLFEYDTENGTRYYMLPPFVEGSGEWSSIRMDLLQEAPNRGYFFERETTLAYMQIGTMIPPGGGGTGMHVIPVEEEVQRNEGAVDIEKISYWLEKYDKFAIAPCVCRETATEMGEGAADDPNWCIFIGPIADFIVETGKGRWSTREEAYYTVKRAEEQGYVHQVSNQDGPDKIFVVCNCNVNSCKALRNSQLFNLPNLSRSAYTAKVTTENCVACGKCVEYCPAGAVKLGQKLCTKKGYTVYPKHELPDDVRWGEEKWDVHYRDNNQINCYDTGTAPCKAACPAHIAVQGYLKLAAQGKYQEALALIKKDNPFPAVCGRVCNKRCEAACTRGTREDAVSIDAVKRFIAEQDLQAETRYIPPVHPTKIHGTFDEKIAIIGGGPAGLSCAFYLAEKGYHPTVFEKEKRPGGMMMNAIPGFRLEKELVDAEIDVLREMGVEFRCGVEIGKDISIGQLRKDGYLAFYAAPGLQNSGKLGIPGDDSAGVMPGIEFAKKTNLDGIQNIKGRCVVIGGGNIGADIARTAVRSGADSVDLYCLESYEDMPMGTEDRTECEEEGITIHAGWGQTEVISVDGKCRSIRFRKCVRVRDAEGRFNPQFDDSQTCEAECSTILYCIGQRVEWGRILDGTDVQLNGNKTAKADSLTYQTAEEDIFVGGDAYYGQKFVIDAIECGKQGAESIHRYLRKASLTIGRNRRRFTELDKENIVLDSFTPSVRQDAGRDPELKKTLSFKDPTLTLTEEQVKAETARCLSCGASVVDPNKCIGCGLCTTKCKFDAIHLYRDHPEQSTMLAKEDTLKAVGKYAVKRAAKIAAKKFSRA